MRFLRANGLLFGFLFFTAVTGLGSAGSAVAAAPRVEPAPRAGDSAFQFDQPHPRFSSISQGRRDPTEDAGSSPLVDTPMRAIPLPTSLWMGLSTFGIVIALTSVRKLRRKLT